MVSGMRLWRRVPHEARDDGGGWRPLWDDMRGCGMTNVEWVPGFPGTTSEGAVFWRRRF